MDGDSSLVALIGFGLIIANNWKNGTLQDFAKGQFDTSSTKGHKWYQTPWGSIGLETLGVVVAMFVADASPDAGKVVLVLFVGLALVWGVTTYAAGKKPSKTSSSSSQAG